MPTSGIQYTRDCLPGRVVYSTHSRIVSLAYFALAIIVFARQLGTRHRVLSPLIEGSAAKCGTGPAAVPYDPLRIDLDLAVGADRNAQQ